MSKLVERYLKLQMEFEELWQKQSKILIKMTELWEKMSSAEKQKANPEGK